MSLFEELLLEKKDERLKNSTNPLSYITTRSYTTWKDSFGPNMIHERTGNEGKNERMLRPGPFAAALVDSIH